jgi:phosphatidylglycerophosphate synthase
MKIPTIREIKEKSKTPRQGYEAVLDYLANYVVKGCILLRISPTQITYFWVIMQFLTSFIFLLGTHASFVVGIILFQLMFVVDLSDGKLFRFSQKQKLKPLFPKYLDRIGHFVNNATLFLLLGIGTYLRFEEVVYFFSGLIAAMFYLLNKAISLNPAWYKSLEEQEVIARIGRSTTPKSGKSRLKIFYLIF